MEYYTKEGIKKVYDLIMEKGVTDETFRHVDDLNVDVIVSDLLYRKVDKDILKWITYILHVVYNERGDIYITDDMYDVLYEKNKEINGTSLVGTEVHTLKKYPHKYPMLRGTVEKIHFVTKSEKSSGETRKSYEEWIKNLETRTGISMKGKQIRASLKVDGVSGVLELYNGFVQHALKRGDVENNEAEEIEILRSMHFPEMVKYGECGLKVEIYMRYDKYDEFVEKYGDFNSPRSAVTSIINSDEVDYNKLEYLSIFELEINKDNKSIMAENVYHILPDALDFKALEAVIQDLQNYSNHYAIPADGVVIRVVDEEVQELAGRDGGINKFEIGYKFKPEMHKARLKKVNWSMGKGGSYTPVAEIDPIVISGNEITNISLGSVPRLIALDLRIGQFVYVTYNVIPYLYDCEDDKELCSEKVTVPTHCKTCGNPLKFDKSKLYCDVYYCPSVRSGILLNFASKVGMEGISDATISDLMEYAEVREIYELYDIESHRNTLVELDGYGETSVDNIIKSIRSKRELPLDVLIGSLSIPNVGRRTMKTILNNYSNDEFLDMLSEGEFDKLTKIKGIGESIVNSLTVWRHQHNNYVNFSELLDRVEILQPKKSVDSHSILFTKVRDYDFQEFLENKGYGIADKYTKSVDVVIYGEESKKTEKALKDGKMLLTLEQAYEMYGYIKE